SGRERRLTTKERPEVSYGLAEFVAQEEMNRFDGYWWSPDSRWIAYQRTDTREVERLFIADPAHPEREPDAWPYPRAGKTNADVRLGIVPADGGATTWISWDRQRYPYLARVVWSRNAPLTLVVQNREQTEERLLTADPRSGITTPLWIERDPAWLNLWGDLPRWLPDGSGFLWITERRGAAQLELHERDGRVRRVMTDPGLGLRAVAHVDGKRGIAWVLAGPEPTERHLYRIPLGSRGRGAARVTQESGVYSAV